MQSVEPQRSVQAQARPAVRTHDQWVSGRAIVVTGASRGLGRYFAEELAEAGARVGVLARSEDALRSLASQPESSGSPVIPAACDVADERSITDALSQVASVFGGIDSIIINAGEAPPSRRGHNVALESWHRALQVNLTGALLTARAAYPYLRTSQRGARIVMIGSIMSRQPRPGISPYAASKAGLEGLARALAVDWAPDGINVKALAPGFHDVGLGRPLRQDPRHEDQIARHTVLQRWGTAADLYGPLLLLAGDTSAYLTGQTIVVDGGYSLS